MVKKRSLCIALASVVAVTSMCLLMGMRDAKAQSYDDLLNRIEALESRSTGNVTAPKIRGIKIGGSIRHRFELQHEFGNAPATSLGTPVTDSAADDYVEDFTLQRVRLYFDADVNKNVRAFIKLQDVRTFGFEETQGTPNPAGSGTVGNLSRVDLNEGYIEMRNLGDLTSALENINVRIGRWQWFYGDHRLIGTLNWANQARSYDGARVRWAKNGNWIDLFGAQIDEFDTGSDAAAGESDGRGRQDMVLWGFYSHFKVTDGVVLEPYMINRFDSRDRDGNEGGAFPRAGEHRYTLGARIAGKKVPWLPGVDFTLEQMLQFGDTELATDTRDRDISAFAGAWGVGYTFSDVAWSPRIGYQFAFAEGDDDPNDNDNDTFDHLFPTGHARLGYMDFHGFQNIQAHKIMLTAKPTKKLLLKADFWFFEADDEKDNWYGVVGGSFGAGNTARKTNPATGAIITDDEYGQELDLVFKYKLFKNLGVVGGYSHYFVGDWIEDVRGGDDAGADWFWLQTTVKF
ncbi:MAG: alginate export family protein [Candidatus Scalindua sediminis]|nr:alginate export family protein [Candidatus Scalindua sediminis]